MGKRAYINKYNFRFTETEKFEIGGEKKKPELITKKGKKETSKTDAEKRQKIKVLPGIEPGLLEIKIVVDQNPMS